MATAPSLFSTSLIHSFWEDLQPTPGRLKSTLRIVLASVLALIVLLVLQMPFASFGLYFVFLVGRDSPSVSLRSSILSLLTVTASLAVEFAVVILTDNNPGARVISVAVVAFLAGMVMFASTLSPLASTWGFLFCTVIAIWENPIAADEAVKGSLWLAGTLAVATGAAVAVEYVFGSRHPAERLVEEAQIRYGALEKMFALYARGADREEQSEAVLRVARLAAAGQSAMLHLLNSMVDRGLDPGHLPIGSRVRITMLAELMDVSAAFGSQYATAETTEMRRHCARIAEECHALSANSVDGLTDRLEITREPDASLLGQVEGTLHAILSMPSERGSAADRELVAVSPREVPVLLPGGLRDKNAIAFALKLSLCATLCYILYHAIDWPGISTAVTTVFITGLSSSGAIKQKFAFRIFGSIIGGLILGLGCTAFVFPYMDSITSLVVLIAAIAFISAWCAGGRKFNYVGLQIAFAFYLVAFEGFSAPTELAPARDRLIGILLALVVMWFVFDQIWPVRTVTAMRRALASVIRSEAEFLRLFETETDNRRLVQLVDAHRDQIGKAMAGIRTMGDAVEYELGVNLQQHLRSRAMIIQAGLTAVALFWNQLAVLHRQQDRDFITEPRLVAMRRELAEQLDAMADSVAERKAFSPANTASLADSDLLTNSRYREYTENSLARYGELQNLICGLSFAA
jgi:multidrug resistance protein MdtO